MDEDLLVLTLGWPVSTIDREPSLTQGTLVVSRQLAAASSCRSLPATRTP